MLPHSLNQTVSILQVAISPVILISGVGLLLLTLNSRFGHVLDRARMLATESRGALGKRRPHVHAQIAILYRRARLLRCAMTLASINILHAALLVIALFVAELVGLELGVVVTLLFILCMAALVGALAAFLWDVHLSLVALKLELSDEIAPPAGVHLLAEDAPAPRRMQGS